MKVCMYVSLLTCTEKRNISYNIRLEKKNNHTFKENPLEFQLEREIATDFTQAGPLIMAVKLLGNLCHLLLLRRYYQKKWASHTLSKS